MKHVFSVAVATVSIRFQVFDFLYVAPDTAEITSNLLKKANISYVIDLTSNENGRRLADRNHYLRFILRSNIDAVRNFGDVGNFLQTARRNRSSTLILDGDATL